eukprot:1173025-Pleurochrysis_carterae.AAC.4
MQAPNARTAAGVHAKIDARALSVAGVRSAPRACGFKTPLPLARCHASIDVKHSMSPTTDAIDRPHKRPATGWLPSGCAQLHRACKSRQMGSLQQGKPTARDAPAPAASASAARGSQSSGHGSAALASSTLPAR